MSHLVMMIARIDGFDNPGQLTEIWRQAMPAVELRGLEPEQYLDGLEETVMEVGWQAMRQLLVEQWRLTDQQLVARFRQEQAGATSGDGYDPLKVASRLGWCNCRARCATCRREEPRFARQCWLAGAHRSGDHEDCKSGSACCLKSRPLTAVPGCWGG
ncbi:MAG: hypothetical protein HS114_17100 [Anaerolineales bacterium]|nr:hypothetical protein [Anaerolineales bacterium]